MMINTIGKEGFRYRWDIRDYPSQQVLAQGLALTWRRANRAMITAWDKLDDKRKAKR